MVHHPVFDHFNRLKALAGAGQTEDSFLGTVFRTEFNLPRAPATNPVVLPPPVDEEYFEWIDLLTAVFEARERFVFVELGAGFGRWSIRAAAAARQMEIDDVSLVCVEADPSHFDWLRQTLIDNGIDADSQVLVPAAVVGRPGRVLFEASEPIGSSSLAPDKWYGQRVLHESESSPSVALSLRKALARLRGRPHPSGVMVDAVTLPMLLQPFACVNLVDLDIQGAELEVIASSVDELTQKAMRLHIGTHSAGIETGLRAILSERGWRCVADYACGSRASTPFGVVTFQDGVQSWLNPTALPKIV